MRVSKPLKERGPNLGKNAPWKPGKLNPGYPKSALNVKER